jgi:hypothetical protein
MIKAEMPHGGLASPERSSVNIKAQVAIYKRAWRLDHRL